MKIVKIAWLGHMNYGDDIMAFAMDQYLDKCFSNYTQSIWCDGDVKKSERNEPFLPSLKLPAWLQRWFVGRRIKNHDLLIVGGGSILHSENSITWKLDAIEQFKVNNPSGYCIGINLSLGPFNNENAINKCAQLIDALSAISFRDEDSYRTAKSMSKNTRLIRSADLAGVYVKSFRTGVLTEKASIETVGVSLVGIQVSSESFNSYAKLIQELSLEFSRVILFGFCSSKKFGDTEVIQRIVKQVNRDNVLSCGYDGDFHNFTNELSRCDFIIGQRLHSIIMAYLLNVPFLALSYHRKCEQFFNDIGLSKKYLMSKELPGLSEIIDKVEPYSLPIGREEYIASSMKNFEVFDHVVLNRID